MAELPVLAGPRVTLRAPTLDDADVLFERIASDPEVTRYLSWPTHPDVAETRRVIMEMFNVGDEKTWLIELGMFPNLSSEPQDCLLFAKAIR